MKKLNFAALACYLIGTALCRADYQTNTITTPGGAFAFTVDNNPTVNPTIQLVAGVTNILIIDTASFHPVVIVTNPVLGDPTVQYPGADPQSINSGIINMETPTTGFPTKLYYMCNIHGFYGEIDISPPLSPTPPANTILQVQVGTNIVMTSTGTNTTWLVAPQFSSNLLTGAWAPVPNYTNTFANGTNTTIFPRLDAICGPNVFLRLSQQQN